ncbi:MAG: dipeptidase PepV [Clostridia bacterium]|nr:dipeptidase PepV [Clostridia bacterium]
MGYLELIDRYKDDMIKTLQELVAFKSVVSAPVMRMSGENKDEKELLPFGKGVQDAFEYMLAKAAADGFETENVDNYGGHIEFGGYTLDEEGLIITTSDEVMGIVGHLDVVPEGSDWKYDPFSGTVEGDKIFGRGTIDDKGPVVAAYYAMKAIKDAGIMPAKKVRLVLGLDEETEWKGMKKYLARVKAPDFGFTPDAEFPAIQAEKGIMVFQLARKLSKTVNKGLELRSLSGGNAPNMVADFARAVVRSEQTENYEEIRRAAAEFREETGYKVLVKGTGKSLEITTTGVSAHGARPHTGLNAISIMMAFLQKLTFVNDDVNDFVEFYNKHIGFELDGESLGVHFCDNESGDLILNVGKVALEKEAITLTINVRYPVTCTDEQVYEAMLPVVNKYNMGIVKEKTQEPIFIPSDSPMLKTLMDVYREHTGDTEREPLVIGGGTYARAVKNVIAFGPSFPGEREVAHQKNEYAEIPKLITAAKIYADAIYRLTLPE